MPFLSAQHLQAEPASEHPNVVFIAIDDLNDWIGCMGGHPQTKTPNIDALAARGVLFTNAQCAAPVCLASRTALLSGRYPDQTGVYSNWGATKGKAPAKDLQLPVFLSANGYETLGTGKIYHEAKPAFFDDYFDTEQRWSPFTQVQARYTKEELPSKGTESPKHLIPQGPGGRDWVLPLNRMPSERAPGIVEGESFDWGAVDVPDNEMGDVRITDWARQKLAVSHAKPFFLAVGYYRPHIPLFAPKQDFDRLPPVDEIQLPEVLQNDLDDIGPTGHKFALDPITAGTHEHVVKHHQWKEAVRAYLACVTFVDRQVGRLVEAIDASSFADNTWIILWSDHGWQLGEKEHWGKWTAWRQATRMPLIIVPPRQQRDAVRGKACPEPVSLVDLYPTVLDLARLPPKEGLSGRSLTSVLKNPSEATGRAVVTTIDPGNYTVSTRDWQFIHYQTGEEELYDIRTDPNEWRNLIADAPQKPRIEELRRELAKFLSAYGPSKEQTEKNASARAGAPKPED